MLLPIAPETHRLQRHQHGGAHETSCACALHVPWELTDKKEMSQCCYGITCAGHASTLAKPGYQPEALLLVGAELQGNEWRNGKPNCPVTARAPG